MKQVRTSRPQSCFKIPALCALGWPLRRLETQFAISHRSETPKHLLPLSRISLKTKKARLLQKRCCMFPGQYQCKIISLKRSRAFETASSTHFTFFRSQEWSGFAASWPTPPKEFDAGDFRRLARANCDRVRTDDLRRLAALVWEGGADEINRFIQIALSDEPFPI